MKKIKFNLDYYNAHHPMVETRLGNEVRILCTDSKEKYKPIVALINTGDENYEGEYPLSYHEDGKYLSSEESGEDLFMLVND